MPARPPKLPTQQLLILSLCRLADPISFSSVFPYLPELIQSFHLPPAQISRWAGLTSAVFSLSQALTAILWGRASDRFGRKPVILTGMLCVMASGLLFGFSRSLGMAVAARALAGASNGNIGILRTAVAEMVPCKELQPRAFSVMPLMWTIGSIIGPGFVCEAFFPLRWLDIGEVPVCVTESGSKSVLSGWSDYRVAVSEGQKLVYHQTNVKLTRGVQETLETKKQQRDYGRVMGQAIVRMFSKKKRQRNGLGNNEQSTPLMKHCHSSLASTTESQESFQPKRKLTLQKAPSYREVFSRQTNINLLTYTLLALHSVAYDQLLPIFMHHPQQMDRSTDPNVHLPWRFSGGFGIDSGRIGLLFTLYGVAGTIIQFVIFPPLAHYYGVLNSLKFVTIVLPIVYIATPFTALLPDPLTQQIVMFLIMLVKCFATIFAFPCTTILLTNSTVSMRILGTVNGVATSVSAIGRATGPAIGGAMFEIGVMNGWAILPWWVLAGFAILGAMPVWWLVEMEGFGGREEGGEDEEDEIEGPRIPDSIRGGGPESVKYRSPEVIPKAEPDGNDDFDCANENEALLPDHRLKAASKSSGTAFGRHDKKNQSEWFEGIPGTVK
ncbi:MAG: hypothetical protein Q9219_002305 [cf. Caloplaca sp. 3 TL-2023]